MRPRLVMLDRDGVLNVDRPDSVKSPDELVMLPGAAAAVARLNQARIYVALVSNQSVVGRGVISAQMLEHIQSKLRDALARYGARLDFVSICTDPPWAWRMFPCTGCALGAVRVTSASLSWPSWELASR